MAKLGANVTGIDPAERSIKVAKIHAEKSNSDVNYLCGSSETLLNQCMSHMSSDVYGNA